MPESQSEGKFGEGSWEAVARCHVDAEFVVATAEFCMNASTLSG